MENSEIFKKLNSIESRQAKIETLLLSQKPVLTFEELAEYTGYSRSFLYKLTMAAQIPGAYKPTGKHYFFERKAIDQWLLSNKPEIV
ncbi:MAG: helix-turn-helix domain-containing protein [Lentimicrobium sp.]|jgi:excisionase family DNA binding protein|nr:helix-turn-helix domain-containing protein [Lentimicrobium sp.]